MSVIARVLTTYHPDWEAPEDTGKTWIKCLCPSHDEDRPSAAVSYELNAINCLACGYKGDVISIIRREEGITYGEAVSRAEEISGGLHQPVSRKPARKPRRAVFGEQGIGGRERRPVPSWVRS